MKIRTLAQGRVKISYLEPLAIFTVHRARALHALDLACIEALHDFVEEIKVRPDIFIVVIASEGTRSFLAGGDLVEFRNLKGEKAGDALSKRMGDVLAGLEMAPAITIAAMEGDSYGGGVETALACDMRILSQSSRLFLTQSRFAVTTGWGGGVRLWEKIGYPRALELLLTGRAVDAEEALRVGLVNHVVEDGSVLDTCVEMAKQIATLERSVALGIKTVVASAATLSRDDAMLQERLVFGQLWGDELHEKRVEDFIARKKAQDASKPRPE